MDKPAAALLPGTLELLILKAVSLGELHGYGVLLRIEQISGRALRIQQGALYPALYRLEHKGLIAGEWGTSGRLLTDSGTRGRASARHVEDEARKIGDPGGIIRAAWAAIARFAEAVRPPVRPLPDEATRHLGALVARRR